MLSTGSVCSGAAQPRGGATSQPDSQTCSVSVRAKACAGDGHWDSHTPQGFGTAQVTLLPFKTLVEVTARGSCL